MALKNSTLETSIEQSKRLLVGRRDAENLQLLESTIQRFPDDPEVRLLYATALVPFRPNEAPWQAATAIQLDPDSPSRLTRAASLMFYLGELEAARSYTARASRLAPEDFELEADLTNIAGVIAAACGDDALAERALTEATEAEPQREVFARDLATFLADRGRLAEALDAIDRALTRVGDTTQLSRLRADLVSKDSRRD